MKNKFSVCIIGGTFDDITNTFTGKKGKPSRIIDEISSQVTDRGTVFCVNGGPLSALPALFEEASKYDVVFWFPNVPNNQYKIIREFKESHPKIILVTSKRNDNEKYSFPELINHALGLKANLTVEFYKFGNRFQGRLFDPLGNVWGSSEDFGELARIILARVDRLWEFTRVKSEQLGPAKDVPTNKKIEDFLQLVKDRATTFHDLIHPADGVTRFLGNASFRCERGFPSFKHKNDIYVSRRNIDKRCIWRHEFVQVKLIDGDEHVGYYGSNKPSVDAPVQLRLYERYPRAKYMLHSHVYVKDAKFTECAIPCGALEEYDEIENATDKWEDYWVPGINFAVNLIGHGSIAIADNVDYLRSVEYYARPVPEEFLIKGQKKMAMTKKEEKDNQKKVIESYTKGYDNGYAKGAEATRKEFRDLNDKMMELLALPGYARKDES